MNHLLHLSQLRGPEQQLAGAANQRLPGLHEPGRAGPRAPPGAPYQETAGQGGEGGEEAAQDRRAVARRPRLRPERLLQQGRGGAEVSGRGVGVTRCGEAR